MEGVRPRSLGPRGDRAWRWGGVARRLPSDARSDSRVVNRSGEARTYRRTPREAGRWSGHGDRSFRGLGSAPHGKARALRIARSAIPPGCLRPKHQLGHPSGRILARESNGLQTPSHRRSPAVASCPETSSHTAAVPRRNFTGFLSSGLAGRLSDVPRVYGPANPIRKPRIVTYDCS
jgi:hypothetical protein